MSKFLTISNSLRKIAWATAATLLFIGITRADTPDAPSPYWEQIKKSDAKVTAVKLAWKNLYVSQPRANSTNEADYERAAAQWKEEGVPEERIKQRLQASRQVNREMQNGFTKTDQLTCIRVGEQLRGDRISTLPQVKGGPAQSQRSYSVDYFDGTHGVNLSGMAPELPEKGTVVLPNEQTMARTAPDFGHKIFLFAAPVTMFFSPEDTTVAEGPNNTVILEKKVLDEFSTIYRATLSKQTWRPVKYEQLNGNTRQADIVFTPSNYVLQGKTAWIPSSLKVDILAINANETYTLEKATVNDDVNPIEVKILNAPLIVDCRLGTCTSYQWTSGIIPDETKLKNILETEQAERPGAPAGNITPGGNIPPLAPIVGLVTFVLGVAILQSGRKSRNKSSQQPRE